MNDACRFYGTYTCGCCFGCCEAPWQSRSPWGIEGFLDDFQETDPDVDEEEDDDYVIVNRD